MKKSTMAVAALLTALSSAPMMSVAYADEATTTTTTTTCTGCKGTDCSKATDKAACCKAASCKGCCGGE
ncbi:MAG: hypothetical protein EPN84_01905 [Legionella sp.]|nr:MAG: hypothetical protein EPN84_01905 [Legionella sp.]